MQVWSGQWPGLGCGNREGNLGCAADRSARRPGQGSWLGLEVGTDILKLAENRRSRWTQDPRSGP